MLDSISRLESEVRGYVRSFPTVFQSSQGATLTDAVGREFVDFFAGAGVLNYGHNNPKSKAALLEYIQNDGIQHGLDMATSAKVNFIDAFESTILKPRNLEYKIQFTGPTGTNSVEAAIKLARKVKQRSHIIAFTNAYHGHTLGSLALTGNDYYHDEHYGSRNNVTHMPFDGYLDGVDTNELLIKMLDDPSSGVPKPAAVILETIQCEGGIRIASREWLQKVALICRERDILLIVDDIQVGNGRSGQFFSFEDAGLVPDMVCVSKAIGGGQPMSLVLIHPEVDGWQPGEHTGTFRGNNLAFVAAAAVLEYWQDNQLEHKMKGDSERLQHFLQSVVDEHSSNYQLSFRGRGMVWGLDFGNGEVAGKIAEEAFNQGLVIETAGAQGDIIKLLPPLTISQQELENGLNILRESISIVLSQWSLGPTFPGIVASASARVVH